MAKTHIYLAAPYCGTLHEVHERMERIAEYSAEMRRRGNYVTTPLFHHWTLQESDVSLGSYWEDYSEELLVGLSLLRGLGKSVHVHLLQLPGWKESKGVERELVVAERLELPVEVISIEQFNRVLAAHV